VYSTLETNEKYNSIACLDLLYMSVMVKVKVAVSVAQRGGEFHDSRRKVGACSLNVYTFEWAKHANVHAQ
jgi:hypothetical protein